MKKNLLLAVFLVLIIRLVSGNVISNRTDSSHISNVNYDDRLLEMVGRHLRTLWDKYAVQNDDSFVGRCFGIAKKLRTIIPIVIFMLGVIMTKLGFLVIFSLKSLALLGLLLLINASGAAAKVATVLAQKKDDKRPQTVHFHIHQGKEGPYHIGHSGIGAWEDRVGHSPTSIEYSNVDASDSYNLYDKLLREPYVRGYGRKDR